LNTTKTYAATTFRFRRWSRAGYAVFCSLNSTVTIGNLAVSVSDKSLKKATGISANSILVIAGDSESPDDLSDLLELKAALQQIQEITFFETSTVSTAACSQYTHNYFIHQNG